MLDPNNAADIIKECRKTLTRLRSHISSVTARHVNKRSVLEELAGYVEAYFRDHRQALLAFFGNGDPLLELDETMKTLLRYTHARTERDRYLSHLALMQRQLSVLERDALERHLPIQVSASSTVENTTECTTNKIACYNGRQSKHRVFVVHGRDEAAKANVARFLERLGLEAIILHEKPNLGRTIIEKLEALTDVHFAVVLLTPDDLGALAGVPNDRQPRARQNVIFEWGYLIRRLGRPNVCALRKGDVELLSDMSGIVYHELDSGDGWKTKLAAELRAAGFDIDLECLLSA